MFQTKSKQLKMFQNKSTLDQILWFVENYLPQKRKSKSQKKLHLTSLEARAINKIQKLASLRSKSLTPELINTKVSFTVGKWALPYLISLKRIGLLK